MIGVVILIGIIAITVTLTGIIVLSYLVLKSVHNQNIVLCNFCLSNFSSIDLSIKNYEKDSKQKKMTEFT